MTNPQPDYRLLYEQSQKRLAETEAKAHEKILSLTQAELKAQQQVVELKQQLHLALLDANAFNASFLASKATTG